MKRSPVLVPLAAAVVTLLLAAAPAGATTAAPDAEPEADVASSAGLEPTVDVVPGQPADAGDSEADDPAPGTPAPTPDPAATPPTTPRELGGADAAVERAAVAPVVLTVTVTSTAGRSVQLTGTGEPGATVEVMAADWAVIGPVVNRVVVGADGTFDAGEYGSIFVPLPALMAFTARQYVVPGTVDSMDTQYVTFPPLTTDVPGLELYDLDREAGTVKLRGTARPGTYINLYVNGYFVGVSTVADDGTWSWPGLSYTTYPGLATNAWAISVGMYGIDYIGGATEWIYGLGEAPVPAPPTLAPTTLAAPAPSTTRSASGATLPRTGSDAVLPIGFAAAGLLAAGSGVLALRRRRVTAPAST